MVPVRELFCKLSTRSWSRLESVREGKKPPRSKLRRMRRMTLCSLLHSTPCQLQNGVLVVKLRWLFRSAFDLNAKRDVGSEREGLVLLLSLVELENVVVVSSKKMMKVFEWFVLGAIVE